MPRTRRGRLPARHRHDRDRSLAPSPVATRRARAPARRRSSSLGSASGPASSAITSRQAGSSANATARPGAAGSRRPRNGSGRVSAAGPLPPRLEHDVAPPEEPARRPAPAPRRARRPAAAARRCRPSSARTVRRVRVVERLGQHLHQAALAGGVGAHQIGLGPPGGDDPAVLVRVVVPGPPGRDPAGQPARSTAPSTRSVFSSASSRPRRRPVSDSMAGTVAAPPPSAEQRAGPGGRRPGRGSSRSRSTPRSARRTRAPGSSTPDRVVRARARPGRPAGSRRPGSPASRRGCRSRGPACRSPCPSAEVATTALSRLSRSVGLDPGPLLRRPGPGVGGDGQLEAQGVGEEARQRRDLVHGQPVDDAGAGQPPQRVGDPGEALHAVEPGDHREPQRGAGQRAAQHQRVRRRAERRRPR